MIVIIWFFRQTNQQNCAIMAILYTAQENLCLTRMPIYWLFKAIWLFLASTWSKRDFSDILKLLDFSPLLGVIGNGRKSCKVFTNIVNMRKKFSFQHSWKKTQKMTLRGALKMVPSLKWLWSIWAVIGI